MAAEQYFAKVSSVTFRHGVSFNGKKTWDARDAEIKLHPTGVILYAKPYGKMLVPYSNVLWMSVE